jgi:hypothetical protein
LSKHTLLAPFALALLMLGSQQVGVQTGSLVGYPMTEILYQKLLALIQMNVLQGSFILEQKQ